MEKTSLLKKLLLPLLFVAALPGCTKNEEGASVTDFELNKNEIQLRIGETQQLIGIVTPDDAAVTVSWASENTEIATVGEDGLVTAVSEGETTIVASVADFTAECSVTVLSDEAVSIKLNKIELNMAVGDTETLIASVTPEGTDIAGLEWKSSDSEVAAVDKDGVVKAVYVGEAIITASLGEAVAECSVHVSAAEPESMTLNMETAEVTRGETVQLVANILPEGTGAEVTWSTSNYAYASVEDGLVTTLRPGEVVITARCADLEASCTITILPIEAESLTLETSSIEIKNGEQYTLKAIVTPEDNDETIEWTSSDETVAIVSQEGIVAGISAGSAVITASIRDLQATCNVTVTGTDGDVAIGDFFYSDGTTSNVLDPSKTPIGIVYWLGDPTATDPTLKKDHPDCTHGLVLALGSNEDGVCWMENFMSFSDATSGMSVNGWILGNTSEYADILQTSGGNPLDNIQGYNNTKALEFFNAQAYNAEWPVTIIPYVQEYREQVPAPSNTSDWYIPSPKEQSLFCTGEFEGNLMGFEIMMKADMKNLLNTKLEQIEGAVMLESQSYWSSAVSTTPTALVIAMDFSWITLKNVQNVYPVRCVLAF